MHCFCGCSNQGTILDKKTGRFYCGECWEVIQTAIKDKGDDDEDPGVSEVEVEDFEPINEHNYNEFNLPVEDYYDE